MNHVRDDSTPLAKSNSSFRLTTLLYFSAISGGNAESCSVKCFLLPGMGSKSFSDDTQRIADSISGVWWLLLALALSPMQNTAAPQFQSYTHLKNSSPLDVSGSCSRMSERGSYELVWKVIASKAPASQPSRATYREARKSCCNW